MAELTDLGTDWCGRQTVADWVRWAQSAREGLVHAFPLAHSQRCDRRKAVGDSAVRCGERRAVLSWCSIDNVRSTMFDRDVAYC